MRLLLRNMFVLFVRLIGGRIRDVHTGEVIDRGLVLWFRGNMHVLGASRALVPVIARQKRICYWQQSIGFTVHPKPDYPRLRVVEKLSQPADVLLVILDHREPSLVDESIRRWQQHAAQNILLAYGGPEDRLKEITHPQKYWVSDDRLRVRDPQRDRQSYRGVMRQISKVLEEKSYSHVLFMEYDQIPIDRDPISHYLERMVERDADVLVQALQRVDGSIFPHWLACPPADLDRPEVLSMLGTGHLWTREAWLAVSADTRLAHWYLELDMPTTAHQLGYRLVGLDDQDPYVRHLPGHWQKSPDAAKRAGAWTLHPVK
jgi:hypothetical protein